MTYFRNWFFGERERERERVSECICSCFEEGGRKIIIIMYKFAKNFNLEDDNRATVSVG
jgi:hypothetical protein